MRRCAVGAGIARNLPPMKFPLWLKIAVWSLVVALGVSAIAVLAWSRGEPVSALWMVVAALCVFAVSYRFHSAWLMAKVLTLDELRATPAVVHEDGKDFVKTNKWVVFGHHFAAIAGPGPLVGPVLAAQFGFLPGMLWMLVGATLGGAVHDCVIMFCSVRRRGKSLAQMVRDEVGPFAGIAALVSIIAIMVILLAVLALVVVNALAESPWGLFTIAATMPIAIIMGCWMRYGGSGTKSVIGVSVFGVAALLAAVWAGQFVHGTQMETWLTLKGTTLAWWIMGYGLLASILPVWLLLAPARLSQHVYEDRHGVRARSRDRGDRADVEDAGAHEVYRWHWAGRRGAVVPVCFYHDRVCGGLRISRALISSGTTPKLIANEKHIRVVGYGAMVTEMVVGIMALIAACAMEPGEYFAINMKGEPAAVTAKVTALGFPVTETQMSELAASVGEKTMIGRTGGAPTFAVGMAQMFATVLGSKGALALWYHFAIMFEALFILTTIDAGTRVGRFLVQDLLGLFSKKLGDTQSFTGNTLATLLFVGAWGWFLYQGVIDPLGGINSLWPIFGVANQLLAVIAFTLGTTVLIKMGRARYAWVTLAPLAWLMAVTMTAGWMKIFSPAPVGFLALARSAKAKIAAGGTPAELKVWHAQVFNNHVDVAVTGTFMVLVLVVVAASARVWWQLLAGRRAPDLREEPYVALEGASAGK